MESEDFLKQALETRRNEGNLRKLQVVNPNLIDFCSNDFLGFGKSEIIQSRVIKELGVLKNSPFVPSSRLIAGNHQLYFELETYLAKYHNASAGLIFNSGYAANLGVLSSVPQRGDTIVYDEQIHASARDGIRLSLANSFSFKHNNLEDLEKKLEVAKGMIFVVVEGIYSMDGDSPDLEGMVSLKKTKFFNLIVDEAHSTGVVGNRGEGICVDLGIEKDVFARIMTFGKAIGANGAVVLGSEALKEYLINFARQFIYTTALLPNALLKIKIAYEELEHFDFTHLRRLSQYFSQKFKELKNIQFLDGELMKGIVIPGNDRITKVGNQLRSLGLNVKEVKSPTVPVNSERLRICLHQFNKINEIDLLFNQLKNELN